MVVKVTANLSQHPCKMVSSTGTGMEPTSQWYSNWKTTHFQLKYLSYHLMNSKRTKNIAVIYIMVKKNPLSLLKLCQWFKRA